MGRTLVIHPGALGDVLLAIPALRAIVHRDAGAEIILAAQSPVGDLLHALGVVGARVRFDLLGLDRLFVDEPLEAPASLLVRADHVVSWFGARDPTFAKQLAEIVPSAIVAAPWTPDTIVWQHLLATVGHVPDEADRRPVRVPDDLVVAGRRALESAGWDGHSPLVVAHPGAGGAAKRWSPEGYAIVLDEIRARAGTAVVVHEGPADRDPAGAVLSRLDPPVRTLDNPTLQVLAGALAHARVYIGNDSGVSHLAAAVGTPSVVLFTRETHAWVPWCERARVVIVSTPDLVRADIAAVTAALSGLLS